MLFLEPLGFRSGLHLATLAGIRGPPIPNFLNISLLFLIFSKRFSSHGVPVWTSKSMPSTSISSLSLVESSDVADSDSVALEKLENVDGRVEEVDGDDDVTGVVASVGVSALVKDKGPMAGVDDRDDWGVASGENVVVEEAGDSERGI